MKKTIFKYSLEPGEPLISQGDIFSNLPYFSYDFLLRASPRSLDRFDNESFGILHDVIINSNKIQFEGFYYPRWGIIASQDCDIKPEKDLIFYLLEETTTLNNDGNIIQSVNNKIKNSTRRLYLPKLILSEDQTYGPFEIIFQNPFTVPFEIISNNLKKCWRARLIESARKVFIGKLSQFFTRLPIEEFIFLENQEITRYLVKYWDEFRKSKKPKEFNNKVNRIKEILEILKLVNRKGDISKIFYHDINIVEKIKEKLSLINWFPRVENLVRLSNEILGGYEKNEMKANILFEEFIREFLINEDSFVNQFSTFYNTNSNEIMEMRKGGEVVTGILPDQILSNKGEYQACASSIFNTNKFIKSIPKYLKEYNRLFLLLNNELNTISL